MANSGAKAAKLPSLDSSPTVNGDRTVPPNDESPDGAKWRRTQDVLAAFSPAQQSRFSEASTDLSDSRAQSPRGDEDDSAENSPDEGPSRGRLPESDEECLRAQLNEGQVEM